MVTYEISSAAGIEAIALEDMAKEWLRQEGWTQQRGDAWHESRSTLLLRVPSVIIPLKDSPDANVLINHNHPDIADVKIASVEPGRFSEILRTAGWCDFGRLEIARSLE